MITRRWGHRLATMGLAVAAAVIAILLTQMLLRDAPPTFTINRPLVVVDADGGPFVRAGHTAYVRLDYCKRELVPSEVGVFLLSSDLKVMYPVITMTSNLPTGCHVIDIVVPMPQVRTPGVYRLYMSRRYMHSLFEPSIYLLASDPFTVQVP